jgi:polyhydroxyalkanoate synthase
LKFRYPGFDGTRMARAAHGWYLRNTYVENNLVQPGKVHLKGEALDLGRIRQDIYAVGAEKDHIVPWDAAFRITQLTGGKVRFVRRMSLDEASRPRRRQPHPELLRRVPR